MTTNEPTTTELLGTLVQKTGTLVRQEVQLARVEMTDKAKEAARDASWLVAGAVLGHAGVLALVFLLVLLLTVVVPLWLSALLVGAALIGVGYALVRHGLTALKGMDATPRQTLETVSELTRKEQTP